MLIEGSISVKSALKYHKRKVNKVLIDDHKHDKDFNYIRFMAKKENIEVVEAERTELDKLALSRTYGGILAEVEERRDDDFDESDIFAEKARKPFKHCKNIIFQFC